MFNWLNTSSQAIGLVKWVGVTFGTHAQTTSRVIGEAAGENPVWMDKPERLAGFLNTGTTAVNFPVATNGPQMRNLCVLHVSDKKEF